MYIDLFSFRHNDITSKHNYRQERIMRREGRGEECDTTTHLIKIQVFTHASRVTIFSTFIFKMKAENLGVSTYTTRWQCFSWIWDSIKAYWSPKNRPEAFCGALRSPISCSSRSDLAVSVNLPEMMLDRSSSIASTLGGSLERELRVIKATRTDRQASFLADWRKRLNRRC